MRGRIRDRVARRGDQRALRARLAELHADPVLGDVVEASTDVGVLLLHGDDQVMTPAIRQDGYWEPSEAAWLRSVLAPGQTAIDCGANVGYFTVLASRAVGARGSVLAVEPGRDNLRLLAHNLWRNRCDNVTVLPVAAWSSRGLLGLRRSADNRGDHRTHPATTGPMVPSAPLDELLDGRRVDVIKIDTQGADHHVVDGLADTLGRSRGCMTLIEFWLDGMSERDVDPLAVLARYRALGRPLGLLGQRGEVTPVTDAAIMAAAAGWEGRWVNLVLGAAQNDAGPGSRRGPRPARSRSGTT